MQRFLWILFVPLMVVVMHPSMVPAFDRTTSFSFDGVPSKDAYETVAEHFGVHLNYDPRLKHIPVEVKIVDMGAKQSLDLIAHAAGHFLSELGEGQWIVATDTPERRREFERLGIQTYVLEHLSVKEADRLLRSLVEVRRLFADEELNTVTVRDSQVKLCLVERLLEIADQPLPEVEVAVSLLEVRPQDVMRGGAMPAKLGAAETRLLLGKGSALWSGGLTLVGAESGKVSARIDRAGFSLSLKAMAHGGSGEATVDFEASGNAWHATDQGNEEREGATSSSVRLAIGEAAIIRVPDASDDTLRLLLISPTAISGSPFTAEDLAALKVGTEAKLAFDCNE